MENLPPHVVIKIFKNLNVSDIIKLSMSNKRFHELATHNKVWKARCLELRSDILFLSVAGNMIDPLPSWLVHYDEIKNHTWMRPPPRNFFFLEFMRVWCRYPHAWKRGNTIVDTKYVQLKQIKSFDTPQNYTRLTEEVVIFEERATYENWREWYRIVVPATIWLHNRQNGAYEIKRYTIKEPFFFELPFSNLLYGVDAKDKKILSFRKPTIPDDYAPFEAPRFTLYNRKLERRFKKVKLLMTRVMELGLAAFFGLFVVDQFMSYRVPYYIMHNIGGTCEIVRPTMEKLLDPEFQGSLVRAIDLDVFKTLVISNFATSATAAVSALADTTIRRLQSVFGVVSLFAYDEVRFENIVPSEDLSIFITTENDVSKYECTVVEEDDGRASTWPAYWIHDMDDGKYDQLGSSICINCNQLEGTHELHGLKELGAFCGNECAQKFWNKK